MEETTLAGRAKKDSVLVDARREASPLRARDGWCHVALLALTIVALAGYSGCEEPPKLDELSCHQSPYIAPLPPEVVAFLPPTVRAGYLELAEALQANGTVTLAHQSAFTLPKDLTWQEDPFGDPTWLFEFQSLYFVLDLLLAYRDTADHEFLDLAEGFVDEWMHDHNDASYEGPWGDLVTANRTRTMLLAWELLRHRDAQSESVAGLCRHLEHHGNRLADLDAYTSNHNHGYFQDEALLLLAHAMPELPNSHAWEALALDRLSAQIDFSVTADGVHREHSPSYHAGMLLRFINLDGLLTDLGLTIAVDLKAVIQRMYGYIAFAALPDARAPLLGDSSRWIGSSSMEYIPDEALYSLTVGHAGHAPAVVDAVFSEGGYAFFRDGWHSADDFDQTVYVAFVASAFSRSHKHCDDLSLLLYGYGKEWLVDAGFHSYDDDDPYHGFSLAPRAHNVVEVDGTSYFDALPADRDTSSGLHLITAFELGVDRSTVEGEHRLNDGVLFTRSVEYERPARVVARDSLRAEDDQEHAYVLYWHIAPDKQVEQTAPGEFWVSTDDATGPSLRVSVTGTVGLSCDITEAATDPYQGWVFPEFLQAKPAPVIHCLQEGTDVEFLTTLELSAGARFPR